VEMHVTLLPDLDDMAFMNLGSNVLVSRSNLLGNGAFFYFRIYVIETIAFKTSISISEYWSLA
jgi:hypothetical protein